MILYNNIFRNSEEFAELFGTPKNRKNKIFLAVLKSPMFQKYNPTWWDAEKIYGEVLGTLVNFSRGLHEISVLGYVFASNEYLTDERQGLCNDMDFRAIRYCKNVETNNGTDVKVYKMKAGRLLRKIAEATTVNGRKAIEYFSEPVFNYVCEEFQRRWEKFAAPQINDKFILKTGDTEADFKRIYDRYAYYKDDTMSSCMQNQGQHVFYTESVTAKAAWLEDENGEILARCVIFTEVEDCDNGEVLRLAERQYAVDCGIDMGDGCVVTQDNLKRILVDKLIAEGEIDGYKAVGAGCHEASAFVSKDGKSWSDRNFKIECSLDPHSDTLSYQDSFKYYNESEGVAYNNSSYRHDWDLDTTDSILSDDRYYDEYNGEYIDEGDEHSAMYHGREIYIGDTSDFNWSDMHDIYIHEDDCVWCENINDYVYEDEAYECPECGEWFYPDGSEYYSELTDETYCCESCMEDGEESYKERHWFYSEITEEYYEDEDELNKAEAEYKAENWYYSELLDEFFEYASDKEDAEFEYKKNNWYKSPYDGEYYETRNDSDDDYILADWLEFLHDNLQNLIDRVRTN